MRWSSVFVAPSAVAILSTALLCGLSGTAVSQTEQAPRFQASRSGAEAGGKATQAEPGGKHSCISPDIANHSNACARFSIGEACRARENLQQLH